MINQHPHGITRIDADYVAPGLACVYLLREGDRLALIETGAAATVAQVLEEIGRQGLTPEAMDYIILTHIHLDHAAGAGELMRLCPNAKLVVHPRGAPHMISPEKLEAGTRAVYGDEEYERLYGALVPVPVERVIEATDGMTIDWQGRELSFLDTPGHALHHVVIHDKRSNVVFTGDTFGLSYRQFDRPDGRFLLFVTTTPVHFDPQAMARSIDRIAALTPEAVALTHYDLIPFSDGAVLQLSESLQAFTELALTAQGSGEARVAEVAAGILDWLTGRAMSMGNGLTESAVREWLAMDARLNAQGLEVWLNRREKPVQRD